MQITMDPHEAWSVMSLIVSQVLDNVELSGDGRDAVKKWRSEYADGSTRMNVLVEEMNVALGGPTKARKR